MEASTGSPSLPAPAAVEPNADKIKRSLIQRGVNPTPKIIHTLRKKHLQKALRKSKRALSPPPQPQPLGEEADFQAIKAEWKAIKKFLAPKAEIRLVGKPWEALERIRLRELAREEYAGGGGDRIKSEHLRELSDILETDRDKFRWLLDDDVEMEEGWFEEEKRNWAPAKRSRSEAETIRFLVDKLSCTELSVKDWKFYRMMKQSGLQFTEGQLLKLVEGLGGKGKWRHALSVVHWVYGQKEHRHYKSRFVFTKLLAVLGKARRTHEALQIFDLMREDCQTYPDMAAYHSIAVTLGQAGLLKKLLNIVECMREKPTKRIRHMRHKNWDPALQPDLVVFNAVLNACVPSHQWKGVSWVFEQLRKNGLKPNGATYGLAMEVMLHSGKYDLVHEFYGKMRRSGEAPKALTYKVLVRAFWEQGKVEEAVQTVRDMEQRGVVGTACVYYELACCLCSNGRWQEALVEVVKLKKLPHTKPLEVTFTGMIKASMDAGHIQDCMSIFQHAKDHCVLDIGIVNIMLKVYGRNDMFSKARELFEEAKRTRSDSNSSPDGYGYSLIPDAYTYNTMLDASARALQWEYFEYVYREMVLSGYLLDQSKHALLLVEASIAGKWHLLEHTFDTMLEAGEIPHPSFFTELMCQAVLRHDYERVVNIIKAMAYAPFQVSELQWTDLLERNRDRISQDSLRNLLETISSCDLPMEATVSNLSRSLLSLCRPDDQRGDPTADCPSLDQSSLAAENGNIVDRTVDADPGLGFSNHNCNGDGKARLFPNLEDDLAVEMAPDEFADYSDDEPLAYIDSESLDNEEVELEIRAGDAGRTTDEESGIPSANEILKSWKQGRTGMAFSFPSFKC